MLIERRKFLTGLFGLIAAPAIVRIENIMPVRMLAPDDPLVRGIVWQSWPFGMPTPEVMLDGPGICQGSIRADTPSVTFKPLSHFVQQLESRKQWYPNLVYRPLHNLERV